MARRVSGWDGLRAWSFIRVSREYRAAWKKRLPQPGLPERAPFPVRLQTVTDSGALRWGMAAWEDPYAELPLAPFWAQAGVLDGEVRRDAWPLVQLAAEGGATLSGLRLGDGTLMLRIELPGRSVQVRLPTGTVFPEDGGLLVIREVERIEDVWLGAPIPRSGRGTGEDGDRELLLALESEAEGLTHRQIAERLWGAEWVAEEWWVGGWMHSRVKRRRRRAKTILRQYRDMATGP